MRKISNEDRKKQLIQAGLAAEEFLTVLIKEQGAIDRKKFTNELALFIDRTCASLDLELAHDK